MEKIISDPVPTPAATIILIRQSGGRLQAYLLKRSSNSGFMANLHVFPGGTLCRADHDHRLWRDHGDLSPRQISRLLAGDVTLTEAAAYAVAAIRECLEEAGVFFARSDGRSAEEYDRIARIARTAQQEVNWFNEMVRREGWVLELSALHCWSHWITPPQMRRRYDTRFFVAVMPAGQSCRPDDRETVAGLWITPEKALTKNLSGLLPLSPPTVVTLHELLNFRRPDEVLAAARSVGWGAPKMPRLILLDNGALILEPWDPAYKLKDIESAPHGLKPALLEVGEPFSRLWCADGIWRPVGTG